MPRLESFLASPSRVHEYLQGVVLGRTINDEAVAFLFPGILALLLAVIALVTWRPRSAQAGCEPTRDTGFSRCSPLVSTLMFVTWPIEIWRYVYWLPGFNFIRVPSRFILLMMLCLAVLAAVAFDRLTVRRSARARLVAAAVLATLLLAEYTSYPFAGVPYALDIPAIDRWLDTLPKPFVIAEVPVPSPGQPRRSYERHHTTAMLHATAHWQKTVHGYSGIRRPLHDELYLKLTDFPEPASHRRLARGRRHARRRAHGPVCVARRVASRRRAAGAAQRTWSCCIRKAPAASTRFVRANPSGVSASTRRSRGWRLRSALRASASEAPPMRDCK